VNTLLEWLADGDLRTDGAANEVAALVEEAPELVADLVQGLHVKEAPIRGRAADALEKVARSHPGCVIPFLRELVEIGKCDPVPMVRWHVAMTLGHLVVCHTHLPVIRKALLELLKDPSVFVRSWAIASLCVVARERPRVNEEIVRAISVLARDRSPAVRTRVRKAIAALTDPNAPLPAGWAKSHSLKERNADRARA
jgi:HEAT repeat protein